MADKEATEAPQAGGGVFEEALPADEHYEISPVFMKHINSIREQISDNPSPKHDDKLVDFFESTQRASPEEIARFMSGRRQKSDHEVLMSYIASPAGDILAPPLKQDLSWPMSNYYISSSHNTYLTGNQLSSEASVEVYKNVLLRGCRCVEIDVWNGTAQEEKEAEEHEKKNEHSGGLRSRLGLSHSSNKTNQADKKKMPAEGSDQSHPPAAHEPRVLHGYTMTKEVSFRSVCAAIRDAAFVQSDLPVIVSFEVHANLQQQAIMVDIISEAWRGLLVDVPHGSAGHDTPLPAPGDLKKKILIKVKYTPPEKARERVEKDAKADEGKVGQEKEKSEKSERGRQKTGPQERASSPSSSDEDQSHGGGKPKQQKKKKKKILDELSHLGIYTRSFHFKAFDQPEARIPTHIFSLSEGAFLAAHETSPDALFQHNRRYLLRAYPKGLRVSSSNLNPAPFWRYGVQIAALNWQRSDKALMLNEGMFAGTGGWVLKPKAYRAHPHESKKAHMHPESQAIQSTPKEEKAEMIQLPPHLSPNAPPLRKLNLYITLLAAQDLPVPKEHPNPKSFRPYLKIIIHTESLSLGDSPSSSRSSSAEPVHSRADKEQGASKTSKLAAMLHKTKSKEARDAKGGSGKEQAAQAPKPKLKARSPTARHHGTSPDFEGAVMKFEGVDIDEESLCFVRFKVIDDVEFRRDDMAAWGCVRLDRLREGVRVLQVFDASGRESEGRILCRVRKEWIGEGGKTEMAVR